MSRANDIDAASPQAEYQKRLRAREAIAAKHNRRHHRIGNAKLAIIVLGIVVVLSLFNGLLSGYWILAPFGLFVALGVWHEYVLRAKTAADTSAALYRKGLARMDDKWTGSGATGERLRNPNHVYAEDLDLFGRGCLFELLSTARLPMGEERLAAWLFSPSPVSKILERQRIVAELRDKLDLREDIAVAGEDLRPRMDPAPLIAWAETKPVMTSPALRLICLALAVAVLFSLAYLFLQQTLWPLALILGIELMVYAIWRRRAETVMETLHCNAEGLTLFARILERVECEQFLSPHLQAATARLTSGQEPASRAIRRLARIVYWIDGRDGMLVKMLDLPLLYSLQAALAADAWRMRWGAQMRAWMEVAGEVEALLSLATYSFEHPADPFPEFVPRDRATGNGASGPGGSAPIFDGQELGHPLIPSKQCVRNSVRLDATTRVMLISGSNMSGKSTLLRTVGINVVLAMAGAPIRGKSLRLTPVALGTRIRSSDSLQEGRSNFYTEILHIRRVFDLFKGNDPLLFLFDELLEGTNSKDRHIGAQGLLRALMDRGAIGIVTTHDLALTTVTAAVGKTIRNFHFQDHVENDQMRFDYKLRDGVVAKSNAIELMRLVGLSV